MADATVQQLKRLAELANLKAERALSDLSQATAESERIKNKIADLDRTVSAVLTGADDPHRLHLALRYADVKRVQRGQLLAELARAELRRKADLKVAQREEGRRIAVEKLRDQAS